MNRRVIAIVAIVAIAAAVVGVTLITGTADAMNQASFRHIRYARLAEMRRYINISVDPCDNFYDFACGHWPDFHPTNLKGDVKTTFLQNMKKALDRKILDMFNETDAWNNEIDRKVKVFYESCKHLGDLEKHQAKLRNIAEEFGKVPALTGDNWQKDEFNWLEVIARIAYKYGQSIILGCNIEKDFRNNAVNRIYVEHPALPLQSRDMYVKETNAVYRHRYGKIIAKDLQLFWALSQEKSEEVAKQILKLEVALAYGIEDDKMGLQLDEMATFTTLGELQNKYESDVDFIKYLNISLGTLPSLTEPIYEMMADYQVNAIKVIKETPKEHVANYIYYTLTKKFMLSKPETEDELVRKCLVNTKAYFAKILDNMIYRKYNSVQTERDIKLMWEEIKFNFKNLLRSQKLDWIIPETRKNAEEKLEAMKLEINSYANDNFSKEFGELIVHQSDYVENLRNIFKLNAKKKRNALNESPGPAETGERRSYTPEYHFFENRISLPVAVLQPYSLWSNLYPHALNFGALGFMISHELIHAFDATGRKFDKAGNNIEWWDKQSADAFNERTKCFVNQYKKYIYEGEYLPEKAAQSENIADNGGLHLAYEAYLNWLDEAERTNHSMAYETFPRFNYNLRQLFFISYAQIWCSDVHPAMRRILAITDVHVPSKFRVIGPLSNFREFAKEFNCPLGSFMNPVNKCFIY